MPEILSQQEIDSLLAGLSTEQLEGEAETIASGEEKEVITYDFRRPSRVSKNQIRTIQTIHQNFAEAFGYYLVSRLQTPLSIQVENVDQLFYSEFILSVSKPSVMFILDVSGDRGQIIIEMSPQFAFVLIERLLGGGGLGTEVAENLSRPLTQIEQSLIRGMIERASEELKKAWSMIDTLEFTVQKYESDADIVQVAPASEIVLVISFNISLEDKIYHLSICYPVFTIEDSIAKITTQRFVSSKRYSSAEYSRYISRRIRTTKVPIRVELGQSEITLEELMKLEVGDIIILDTKVDSEVKIFIADRLKLFGKPGVYDGRKAVKITRIANNEE